MGKRRRADGLCHICGTFGPLSFEHIPPRAAFNDRPVVKFAGKVLLEHGLDAGREHGTFAQRGAGAHTLCARCNNNTGAWYGHQFVDWCYQGMEILLRAKGRPTLIYLNHLFPLAILKQVVTMFFSVNSDRFRLAQPYLVDFILSRDRKYLPPNIRIYAYYTLSPSTRSIGISGIIDTNRGRARILSELSFPPFGYVLMFAPDPPDSRLIDITPFARYDYNEFAVMNLQLPVLETHLPLPGDYRTRDEIERDVRTNREADPSAY